MVYPAWSARLTSSTVGHRFTETTLAAISGQKVVNVLFGLSHFPTAYRRSKQCSLHHTVAGCDNLVLVQIGENPFSPLGIHAASGSELESEFRTVPFYHSSSAKPLS